jgi:tetratricopeptide (TPR) repeat protein
VATKGRGTGLPRRIVPLQEVSMRRIALPLAAVILAATAAAPAIAQNDANAGVCAAENDPTVAPMQRINACTALIEAAKDGPGPELSRLLTSRGSTYWLIAKNSQALADLDRAIALDASNARAYRERANLYRSSGRIDRALADANEAVRLDSKNAESFDVRGNVFNNNRQFDRAIEDYSEALRLDPKSAQTFMDRGVAYYFKRDYQSAIKDYDESIKLRPNSARAFTNRGAAYKKLGRHELALADESEAIRINPDDPINFDNRGLSYEENSDYDRAIIDFSEAIRLKPQANFLTNRADCYNHKGDYDRAISDYDRALALDPGFTLALYNRGVAYHAKGNVDRAIADFEQALRVNPQMDEAAEMLAKAREERDRRVAAGTKDELPTFDCDTAKLAVEKAICSDPELTRLDREINAAYRAALNKLKPASARRLRDEQRAFILKRNKAFGNPDYQFKRELERRLATLREMTTAN